MSMPNLEKKFALLSAEFFTHHTGSFRQERWCHFFLAQGFAVDILHCTQSGQLVVEPILSSDSLPLVKKKYLEKIPARPGVRSGLFAHVLRYIKHLFLLDILNPQNLILYFKIRKYILKSNTAILLHCSSPPFYLAVLAAILKKNFREKIFFWVDMRDLWSLHKGIPGPKFHKRPIEHFVLKTTQSLSTVAHSLADRFEKNFGVPADVAYNVATHVEFGSKTKDRLNLSAIDPRIKSERMVITYTGSLPRSYYDLKSFAFFLKKIDADRQFGNRVQFIFAGECDELAKELTTEFTNLSILFLPHQRHEVIKQLQFESDALLFLGFHDPDNQGQMSTKLFEYFETGNGILPVFVNPGSDIEVIMRLYCFEFIFIRTFAEFEEALKNSLAQPGYLPRKKNSEARKTLIEDYKTLALNYSERYLSYDFTKN